MSDPNWTDVVTALTSSITPVLIVVFGFILTRRQSRSDLLLKARFDSYNKVAPDLNQLMCYITFIGSWRDDSPVEIIALKRRLDSNFHVAAPLFSGGVGEAYHALMDLAFSTFGYWGQDAIIRSGAYRRRESWRRIDPTWEPEWNQMFEIPDDGTIEAASLAAFRLSYDNLLAKIVNDLSITRARKEYTTPRVSLNASAPGVRDIPGAPTPNLHSRSDRHS